MKKLFGVLSTFLLVMLLATPAMASDVRTGHPIDGTNYNNSTSDSKVEDTVNSITNEIAPNISTEDVVSRIEDKGNDVVKVMQTVGKYVCIGAFVVCCVIVLIGIIGNKRLLAGGIIGLIVSGVAYAGIVCGREIVNWIAAWAIS